MSEITKLYENAGIKKINIHQSEIDNGDPRFTGVSHSDSYIKYPPFTAEKQIGLIKWMMNKHNCYDFDLGSINSMADTFEEGIAGVVNNLWQYLTLEEKQQVKGILE